MRFSLNFIQEFLEVNLKPAELANKLTMAGMEVESLQRLGNDWVFDIEVTTNRYDWLSIVGIAQEIGAVLGKNLKVKHPAKLKEALLKERSVIIENIQDCPYYIGRSIKGIKVSRANQQIRELVLNCGLTSVNNIVDITNYCMLKWGNPLHAFDEDKLEGNIYIRRAKKGEPFVGIDGKERVLDKINLVVADQKKVVALAGVIGAKNSEVDESTKNIFLEGAIFSPIAVRRSRRAAGVDTESSYRFERRVSADYLELASSEAAQLIENLAKGRFQGVCRAGRKPHFSQKKVSLSLSGLENYLGCSVPAAKFKSIITSLGFGLKQSSKNKYLLSVPVQRFDIDKDVDIYEEVSRIYGYDKISAKLPFLRKNFDSRVVDRSKSAYHFNKELAIQIALLGFKEVITYSIEDKDALGANEPENKIEVINPLRKQESSLRSSLLPGMIKAVGHNLNRSQSNLYFFEIAHIYLKDKKGFSEFPVLALAASGKPRGFFYLKGAVENIFKFTNIQEFEFKKTKSSYFSDALTIVIKGKVIGFIGKVNENIKKNCDLKEDLFFAQLNIEQLIASANQKKYRQFSSYPAVSRDISIALAKDVDFKEVEDTIKAKSNYLADLCIVDIYKGKDVPPETTAFTLRIFYQSPNKTLTSQEVDEFHNQIRQALSSQRGLQLR
ncbi:MAG: phenylalanine--tRNA ligase subunit beta [Candidatus Omnitrophica bacterium]|nr:phenylalanine--tRNA ligase subunit beta [Candidatus Omnitrophota bacterium]